jgi:uncharacterized DUF497 family protein
MKITFDPAKRARTLKERDLAFEDCVEVFAGPTMNITDTAATTASRARLLSGC